MHRPQPFAFVAPTAGERATPRPGDDLLPRADVVMDRGFTVDAPADQVWPWLVQLGKDRAGWYLPGTVERLIPRRHRALRRIDGQWQLLGAGDVIPDYGRRDDTFTVAAIDPPRALVYTSTRGTVDLSWSLCLDDAPTGTRVCLRLRLQGLKRPWLARTVGEPFDLLTVAGMAAGLRERVAGQH